MLPILQERAFFLKTNDPQTPMRYLEVQFVCHELIISRPKFTFDMGIAQSKKANDLETVVKICIEGTKPTVIMSIRLSCINGTSSNFL